MEEEIGLTDEGADCGNVTNPNPLRSAVKRLVMFNGKYAMALGLFWVWAIFFMSEGRETFACLGAASGWIGYALEENKNKKT